MSERVRWRILVATLGQRGDRFRDLMTSVLRQAESHNGAVRVHALWNNGERPLGEIRQALVESANSDYVSFIDDDDVVPDYFVNAVMNCLSEDVDYVGWRMQCILNGVTINPTFHSLEYSHWFSDSLGYYRDISHLNPIRHSIALRADFRRGDPPEDVSWVDQIRATELVRTQCYIDRVMYLYHSTHDSTWRPGSVSSVHPGQYVRPVINDSNFEWHPGSSV